MNVLRIKNYDLGVSESKKKYNEKLFDIVAPSYDAITRVLSFGRDHSWKKKMMRLLPEYDEPSCLDLACGTGDLVLLLQNKYYLPDITGLDLNDVMLDLAKKRFESKTGKVRFEKGDMSDIHKSDASFDVITGGYALRNAPEIKETLGEIYRVLKKGGTCAFLDFSKSRNKILQAIQLFFLKFWGSLWGIIFHGNPEIYGYIADSLNLFPDRTSLKEMLNNSGFIDISSKVLFFGFIEIVTFRK
jgi:ubiquinone/menaquinone biosynthesis methyltransferase